MGLKDLFIISDENKDEPKQEASQESTPTFPTSSEPTTPAPQAPSSQPATVSSTPPVAITPDNPACEPHLEKIIEMYDAGFSGLNQAGYDFYEFYQGVISGGADNPQTYEMALKMGQGMDSSVSKDKLLTQSQFYIDELNEVYNHYVTEGNGRRNQLVNEKQIESDTLSSQLNEKRIQLAKLQDEIQEKETALTNIDEKYEPQLTEIDCKLMANDVAKGKIIETIESVKTGIIKHLK